MSAEGMSHLLASLVAASIAGVFIPRVGFALLILFILVDATVGRLA